MTLSTGVVAAVKAVARAVQIRQRLLVDVIPQKHVTRFSAMTESLTQRLTFPKVWPHIFILLM